MANKKNNIIIAVLVILIAAMFFFKGGGVSVGTPESKDKGVSITFYDKDKNPIQPSARRLMSTVIYESNAYPDIFYLKLGPSVSLRGGATASNTDVTVLGVTAYEDAEGTPVEVSAGVKSAITQAWGCLTQSPHTLTVGDPTFTFDPEVCGGSRALLETGLFEDLTQPIRFVYTLQVEYKNPFDVYYVSTKDVEVLLTIEQDTYAFGGIQDTASIDFTGTGYIQLCTNGQTTECPGSAAPNSACEGLVQTCINSLWPGCYYNLYVNWGTSLGRPYKLSEYTGVAGWETICKDGFDNDCDETIDLADSDCPACKVKFRTSAQLDTDPDVIGSYVGKWIAIDKDKNGMIDPEAYAYSDSGGVLTGDTTTDCHLTTMCDSELVTLTPSGNNKICSTATSTKVQFLYYDSGAGYCKYKSFFSSTPSECYPGNDIYPLCTASYPVAPYSLKGQEVCVPY